MRDRVVLLALSCRHRRQKTTGTQQQAAAVSPSRSVKHSVLSRIVSYQVTDRSFMLRAICVFLIVGTITRKGVNGDRSRDGLPRLLVRDGK